MIVKLSFPPKELSPNAKKKHWGKLARFVKSYKKECWADCLAQGVHPYTGPLPLHIDLVFYRPTLAHYDEDGLESRMKSGLDGIADALKIDDWHFRLTHRIAEETGGYVLVDLKGVVKYD